MFGIRELVKKCQCLNAMGLAQLGQVFDQRLRVTTDIKNSCKPPGEAKRIAIEAGSRWVYQKGFKFKATQRLFERLKPPKRPIASHRLTHFCGRQARQL